MRSLCKKNGFRKKHHRRLWRLRQISAVVGAHIRTEVFIYRELVIFKGSHGFSKEETHQHGYSNLLSPSSSLAFCINPSCSLDSWSLGRTSNFSPSVVLLWAWPANDQSYLCFFEEWPELDQAVDTSLAGHFEPTAQIAHSHQLPFLCFCSLYLWFCILLFWVLGVAATTW